VPAGLPEFRAAVVEHLVRHRGLAVKPEAVLATGGSTAAVAELAAVLLRPGDLVAVEEPGYPRAVATLRAAGLHVLPVPVDAEGLVVAALTGRARAVSAHRRTSSRWALPCPLAAGSLWWRGPASAAPGCWKTTTTASCATTARRCRYWPAWDPTWWCTSAPRARSSRRRWVSGGWWHPTTWWPAVCAHRSSTGVRPSPAGQRVLTALAASGDLARHLRRVRRELLARRDLLVGGLRAAGLPVRGDQAGAHLVVDLPGAAAERNAVRRAIDEGLLFDGLERFYDGPPGCYGVTLGYAAPGRRSVLTAALPGLAALLTAS
jgi:GntR family transcriptional regulator / MocR family aminotransferase